MNNFNRFIISEISPLFFGLGQVISEDDDITT